MIIAIEAQRLFRPKKHGMDIVALELIKNLQTIDDKNEYHLFVKEDVDNKILTLRSNFILHKLPSSPYPWWEQITLPRAVAKIKADVLHCTGNTAPIFSPCPVIITLHDIIYLENNPLAKGSIYQRFGNLYRKFIVPIVVKSAKKIVTVSNFEIGTILKRLPLLRPKLEVVYNGVGTHFFNNKDVEYLQDVKNRYNLPANFILFLGNTAPKKNLDNVVLAFSQALENKLIDIDLVIVDFSEDHLKSVLQRLQLPFTLLNKIKLPGYVKNSDLPAFYGLANLFLYPSLRESFGIPILEAMACATPVITSNTSSMPEVAGEAAIFVDPYDYNDIANKISLVLNDQDLQKTLSEKGLLRAKDFTWRKTAEEMLALYKSFLQN